MLPRRPCCERAYEVNQIDESEQPGIDLEYLKVCSGLMQVFKDAPEVIKKQIDAEEPQPERRVGLLAFKCLKEFERAERLCEVALKKFFDFDVNDKKEQESGSLSRRAEYSSLKWLQFKTTLGFYFIASIGREHIECRKIEALSQQLEKQMEEDNKILKEEFRRYDEELDGLSVEQRDERLNYIGDLIVSMKEKPWFSENSENNDFKHLLSKAMERSALLPEEAACFRLWIPLPGNEPGNKQASDANNALRSIALSKQQLEDLDKTAIQFCRYGIPEIAIDVFSDGKEDRVYLASGWVVSNIQFAGRLKRVFDRFARKGRTGLDYMLGQVPGEVAARVAENVERKWPYVPGQKLQRLSGVEEAIRRVEELDVENRREKERRAGVPIQARSIQVDFDLVQESVGSNPEAEWAARESLIQQAKSVLAKRQWAVFELHCVQEMEVADVATALKITESTVYNTLDRVRFKLGPLVGEAAKNL